jgi:hypothetical protein
VAICAAIGLAGTIAVPTSSAQATSRAAVTASVACAGATRSNPVAVTLTGVRTAYAADGRWSTLRVTLHNRTRTVCGGLKPVLVYAARDKTLHVDALRLESLESRRGGHWRVVPLTAALGELVGAVGPTTGLRLQPGQTTTLTVRMWLTGSAPHGEWLTLAVAYAPVRQKSSTVTWPVGASNPSYFRVVAAHARARTT